MTQQYQEENGPDIPDSFQMLVDLIRETVSEILATEIPDIVSHNIFSLLGAAWQSGYSARDPQIQYYVDRFNEITTYAGTLQETVDMLTLQIGELEAQIVIMVRDKVENG
jgi:hypothetical protein